MAVVLVILAVWIVASVPVSLLVGRVLAVLSRDYPAAAGAGQDCCCEAGAACSSGK